MIYVGPSQIQGRGVFATCWIPPLTMITLVISDYDVTPIGSFVNHSYTPNCVLYEDFPHERYWMISISEIFPGEEIVLDYRLTPDFIDKPEPEWL